MQLAKERRQGVVGGVLILTAASLLVKAIGIFYKIPLSYVLGDEGMGYFNAAYTIYAWLYMLSTAGIPVALSIMISEARSAAETARGGHVVRVASRALFFIGSIASLLLVAFAVTIARLLGTENAWRTILMIAPTLFFICISSLYRGVFQGHQNMTPTAVSQLIEAVGKVTFGVGLAYFASQRGYDISYVSAFAVFGVTCGTAFSTLFLYVRYQIAKKRGEFIFSGKSIRNTYEKGICKQLFSIALPVTVSASVMSLTGLIDLGMIIRRLVSIGYTQAEATALYGNYTTLVVPVFNLPSVVITPIATGIIPAVSSAFAGGNRDAGKRIISGAFKTVGMIAVPSAVGLAVFAKPILSILYPIASVETAYRLLVAISPAVFFLCTLTVANAALQACGKPRAPMYAMLAGGVIKIGVGYIVLGTRGIIGSPIGTLVCYAVALLIDLLIIVKIIDYLPSVADTMIKPAFSSFVSVSIAAVLYYYLFATYIPKIGVLLAVVLSVLIYICVSFAIGMVDKKEIYRLLNRNKNAGFQYR